LVGDYKKVRLFEKTLPMGPLKKKTRISAHTGKKVVGVYKKVRWFEKHPLWVR
jgi:hypothetical protein